VFDRRLIGPLFGLLRTNFILTAFESEQVIGEFNRKSRRARPRGNGTPAAVR
jgi:hypothetical protein